MWKQEPAGWVNHLNDEPWHTLQLADSMIARVFHRCTTQSVGVYGWDVIERCWCGGVRFGHTDPLTMTPWSPNAERAFAFHRDGGWRERNSRYQGTAMLYEPHIRPLLEGR